MLLCFLQSMLKVLLLLRLNINHALEEIVAKKKRVGNMTIELLLQWVLCCSDPFISSVALPWASL